MGLMEFFRKRKVDPEQLLGVWSTGGAEMEFRADGTLDYTVIERERRLVMKLTYRIDGNEIVSNQPSAPREERTKFWFEGAKLVLMFEGERTEFLRVEPSASSQTQAEVRHGEIST